MKIRLYAQPPGRASLLIEVDLPEGDGADPVKLKCFSPPPNDQAEVAQYGGAKAWAVTVVEQDVTKLRQLSADVRIVPFGDAKPRGGGWPVELSFTSGQAEARLNWWMRAPTAWTVVQELITYLMDLAERERSGELDPNELDGGADEDDEVEVARATAGTSGGRQAATSRPRTVQKKGFFGRLLGG